MPDRSLLDVIKPEVRAATAYALKYLEADVKLNQNENPHELPDFLKQKITARFHDLDWNRYPDFVPTRMIEALSRHTGWTGNGILVGNGSNELILAMLVATSGAGRTVAIPQPTFTLYQLLASALGASIRNVPLAPNLSFDVPSLTEAASVSEVLVICSPNNPTGSLLSAPDLARILGAARGLVVVDEAYYEFSQQTVAPLLESFENLVILRTFSKAMALAGIRFGYMLAHPEIVREINKVKLPYNVNIFTLAAAEILIEESYAVEGSIRVLIEERERIRAELALRPGVDAFPSQANFVLFRTQYPAHELFERLYEKNVLVRDVSHYPMLDRALRVTIGAVHENEQFLIALDVALEALNESTDG